jgi:polysaccharide biosynthesis/export protein
MTTRRLTHTWLLVLGVSLVAAALAGAQGPGEAPALDDYRIGPEDLLTIVVWKNDELSRAVTVRPDGRISLPLVNDVRVVGLTAMQLRDELTRRFGEYIPSPEVAVVVEDARSFKISVLGNVRKPGRYLLRSRTTVLDALALAGGLTGEPQKGIVVLRVDGQGARRISFDYERVMATGAASENFALAPNDILLVP